MKFHLLSSQRKWHHESPQIYLITYKLNFLKMVIKFKKYLVRIPKPELYESFYFEFEITSVISFSFLQVFFYRMQVLFYFFAVFIYCDIKCVNIDLKDVVHHLSLSVFMHIATRIHHITFHLKQRYLNNIFFSFFLSSLYLHACVLYELQWILERHTLNSLFKVFFFLLLMIRY